MRSIILLSVIAISCTFAQNLSYTAAISTEKARVGDTVTVTVSVRYPDSPLWWGIDTIPIPNSMGMEFIGGATINSVATDGYGGTTISMRFSPLRTGRLTISPVSIRAIHIPNGDTTSIDTVSIDVKGFSLVGLPAKKSLLFYLPFILVLVGILVIAVAAKLFLRWLEKEKQKPLQQSIPRTPEENALFEISALSLQKMSAEQILDSLSKIIKTFANQRFNIAADGLSTVELLAELEAKGVGGSRYVSVQNALKIIDDIRFAKKYPDSIEIKEAVEYTKSFVTS
jgi:hypothetical protein